jgi:bacterioferritin-associated ferredoxin
MKPDDDLCLCFHVTWRKVVNYIRIHRIKVPSQVAQCQGAGTGCGWCRNSLKKLVVKLQDNPPDPSQIDQWLDQQFPSSSAYRAGRAKYIEQGHGAPPGEKPVDID